MFYQLENTMKISLQKTNQRDYKTLFDFIGKNDFNIALVLTIALAVAVFAFAFVLKIDASHMAKVTCFSIVVASISLTVLSWSLYFAMSEYTHQIAMFCGLSEKEYMQFLLDTEEDGFYREFYINSHEGLK